MLILAHLVSKKPEEETANNNSWSMKHRVDMRDECLAVQSFSRRCAGKCWEAVADLLSSHDQGIIPRPDETNEEARLSIGRTWKISHATCGKMEMVSNDGLKRLNPSGCCGREVSPITKHEAAGASATTPPPKFV